MKKFLKDLGVVLLMITTIFSIMYMLMYAWDREAEMQEQKEIEYMRERGLND